MNPRNQTYLVYFLLLVAVVVMVSMAIQNNADVPVPLTINELASDIQNGSVSRIVVDENNLTVVYADGTEKTTNKEPETSLIDQLNQYGVTSEALTSKDLSIEIKLPSIWATLLSGAVVPGADDHPGDRVLVYPAPGAGLEQRRHGLRQITRTHVRR